MKHKTPIKTNNLRQTCTNKAIHKKEEKDKLKPWVTKGIKNLCQGQNLQTNDKGKRLTDKTEKHKSF